MTTPSSLAIIAASKDDALNERLAAVAATMGVQAPDFDCQKYRRDLVIAPINSEGETLAQIYEYAATQRNNALAAQREREKQEAAEVIPPEPGMDPDTLTDDLLRAAIQNLIDSQKISTGPIEEQN